MASVTVSSNPSTTSNTLTVNFTTDATDIIDIQITKDGSNYSSATSFDNTSATFNASSWHNGTYNKCYLKVIYTENFTVTYNLTNCISSNDANSIKEGNSYSTTISPNADYEMNSISVTIGGSDITSSAVSDNNVNISNVTGNIVITATATAIITYTITNNLSNCTSSNTVSSAKKGSSYTADITANTNYKISSITVTMGGIDITSSTVRGNRIRISNVTGNIVITATAIITYTITNTLSNCTSDNSASTIKENSAYAATITANDGYILKNITVTMRGNDITSSAVSGNTITISSVTGNIIITATADIANLLPPLAQWTKSSGITSIDFTGDYSAAITVNSPWESLYTTVSGLAKGDNITFSCSSISSTTTVSIKDSLDNEIASLSSSSLSTTVVIDKDAPYKIYIYIKSETNGTVNDINLIKNN